MNILNNIAIFIEYLPIEGQSHQWLLVFQEFETLFRQLEATMKRAYDYTCLFVIMIQLLKVPYISNSKVTLTLKKQFTD
jgi:hypothetical protein